MSLLLMTCAGLGMLKVLARMPRQPVRPIEPVKHGTGRRYSFKTDMGAAALGGFFK